MLEVRGIISRSLNRAIFLLFIGLLIIAGLSVHALAQMSDITPNGIAYLSEADTLTAGETYNITVQILYQGGQLKSEGVRVYFLANDTSIIPSELGTYVITDKNGIANYTVTSNKTGDVKMTAFAMNTNSGVSADKKFHVIEGPVATPTATPLPSPSPSPTPTPGPTANATITAIPSLEPTPTAMPTIAPTITAAPTSPSPTGDANAQAIGIITAGIVIAVIIIALVLVARVFKKK